MRVTLSDLLDPLRGVVVTDGEQDLVGIVSRMSYYLILRWKSIPSLEQVSCGPGCWQPRQACDQVKGEVADTIPWKALPLIPV